MASATTGVYYGAEEAKLITCHGPAPRKRNGYKERLHQTWHVYSGVTRQPKHSLQNILPETGKTAIHKSERDRGTRKVLRRQAETALGLKCRRCRSL